MKNFEQFIIENSDQGKFDIINNDLLTEIKEYLLTNYPSDWWDRQLSEKVYEYISEDEVVRLNGESKTVQTTRLGLQVKFVDAQTSEVLVGSGLGEATTIKTVSILDGVDDTAVKFNQSTIGITTKKALETASSRIVTRLIKKGIFKS